MLDIKASVLGVVRDRWGDIGVRDSQCEVQERPVTVYPELNTGTTTESWWIT